MIQKITFTLLLLSISALTYSQNKVFPSIEVTKLDGTPANTNDFVKDGQPNLVIVWATWNKPAILELNQIHEKYSEITEKYKIEIICISIDDVRNKAKVKPFVAGKEWEFTIYQDVENKISKEIDGCMVPSTYILNTKGEIVWEMNGFSPGDLEKIEEALKVVKN